VYRFVALITDKAIRRGSVRTVKEVVAITSSLPTIALANLSSGLPPPIPSVAKVERLSSGISGTGPMR
jgi:hypothetical protein